MIMWFVSARRDDKGDFARFKTNSNEEFYMLLKILDANGYDIMLATNSYGDVDKEEEE